MFEEVGWYVRSHGVWVAMCPAVYVLEIYDRKAWSHEMGKKEVDGIRPAVVGNPQQPQTGKHEAWLLDIPGGQPDQLQIENFQRWHSTQGFHERMNAVVDQPDDMEVGKGLNALLRA